MVRTALARKPKTAKSGPAPSPTAPAKTRRRRLPEIAELEILDAAEKLLRRHSFHELTVAVVMAETDLARPSFYQYFADLHQLLAKLTERYIAEVISIAGASAEPALPPEGGFTRETILQRASYEEGCKLIRRRRHLHRALVDGASSDPSVDRIHRRYMNSMAGVLERQIRAAQGLGYAKTLEPKETARALQLMGEHYIIDKLVKRSGSDVTDVANTLVAIMEVVLFS